jgi:RNA polymerase nonessential primary-like sigma factor
MTIYTTLEQRALTYYRADLNRIAPLTREEEATLVERLRLARGHTLPPEVVTAAKQRLVEGLQRLVMFLALKQAPRFVRLDLEDLTQEASLALLEATERCEFVRENFSGYASYVIRRAFATAWTRDYPVSITRDILLELAKHDAIKGNPLLSADSLEMPLEGTDDLLLADTLEAPTPFSAETSADPQKTALIERLLSRLSERQRLALRMRYGLDEADGRERSIAEIGARLGMTDSAVRSLLQHALISCRRLAARQDATGRSPRHVGPACAARLSSQQEAKLQQAVQAMQERGERITGNRLAAVAHVDTQVARAYVRTHRDPAYEALLDERDHQRLAEACALLEAQGQLVTAQALVHLTHIGARVIGAFLNARAGNAQERLTTAYAQLRAQGHKKIGTRRLSQVAGVSEHRAGLFLRAQAAG